MERGTAMGVLEDIKNLSAAEIAEAAGLMHPPVSNVSADAFELRGWRDAIIVAWEDGHANERQESWRLIAAELAIEAVTTDTEDAWLVFTELRMWDQLRHDDVINIVTRPYHDAYNDEVTGDEVVMARDTFTDNFAVAVLRAVAVRLAIEFATRMRDEAFGR